MAGDDIDVDAWFLVVPVRVEERHLGPGFLSNIILLPGEARPELGETLLIGSGGRRWWGILSSRDDQNTDKNASRGQNEHRCTERRSRHTGKRKLS